MLRPALLTLTFVLGSMASLPAALTLTLTDVTADAGIDFEHTTGAFGEKYMPETFGAGVLWLDIDADGWQDLLFLNGTAWPGRPEAATHPVLYRNRGDGTFADVTAGSGLDVALYGMGGAAADYDNDGHVDIYLTALGPNRLLRGRGDGTFVAVTDEAAVGDPGFSTSALWVDYDQDGHLDLFVGNYVEWTPETDLFCTTAGGNAKSYCTPESYQGESSTLFRSLGNGRFEDVSAASGIRSPSGKALGVAMLDFDNDGWTDLFVANDTQPDQLFRNAGDGTFEDVGMLAGVAVSDTGVARAGMGVDAADYDRSGRPHLVIGHFSGQMMAVYHNEGSGLFIDDAPRSAVGRATLPTLTFGCFFFDVDLDGWLDIFAANGHLDDQVELVQSRVNYAQRPQLFHNLGTGRFEEIAPDGSGLETPLVGRGAAYADYDLDGDLDVVITSNGGPARLLRNDGGNENQMLRIQVEGSDSNRNGIGARIEVTTDGDPQWRLVKTGSSYLSQSELAVTFGLGRAQRANVRVVWPGGGVDDLGQVDAGQRLTVVEGSGVQDATPIGPAQ